MKTINGQKGFTLIELMVTVAILAILVSIAIPAYNGYITTARVSECTTEMAAIKLAQEENFMENNTYYAGSRASGVNTLAINSNGFYSGTFSATDNCTYSVAACAAGALTNCYTLTASGINELASPYWSESYTQN